MTSPLSPLELAEIRATAARARLSATIGALQERAKPKSLVHDVTETIKDRGMDAVTGIVETARSKPARTGAILAVLGLFLARRRIGQFVRGATSDETKS